MGNLLPRSFHSTLPMAVSGENCYLVDSNGKQYLDASGGAAVSCLGHSHERVKDAIKAQIDQLSFAHTGFFTNQSAEMLAEKLVKRAPEGIEFVYFTTGGSESNEAAIKLARQYFFETGQPRRHKIIARQQSYHGATLATLAAGGNAGRRVAYEPLLLETSHISPCYPFRLQNSDESDTEYARRAAGELETEILRVGPESVMAFIAEPVVGASLGAVTAVDGYFQQIRAVCDKYGVLLILDEVMCGMGRTGTLFACEQENVRPDMITIAKGLGAGYQPVGATLVSGKIGEAIRNGSGNLMHGHTYNAHPVACAAGLAVIKAIEEENLLANVIRMGEILQDRLHGQFGQHPNIGDIRGRGLFVGIELVENRDTLAPFAPELGVNKKFKSAAQEAGLICYPGGGGVDGKKGDHILLAPPYIVQEPQIDEIVAKLQSALQAVL